MFAKYLKKLVGSSLTLRVEERGESELKITVEEVDIDE